MATITYLVYLAGMLHVAPFTVSTVWGAMTAVFFTGSVLYFYATRNQTKEPGKKYLISLTREGVLLIIEELFFFCALFFWAWVKGHEPSIHALEKFMDFGFTKSILNSRYFPPPDMWYAGFPINYYYFGHTVMAVLTRLSGIDLSYTFNLMLSSLFAFTLTMGFSIAYQLLGTIERIGKKLRLFGALLTTYIVTMGGNLQTIYAFTKGYTGDNPPPFWTLLWPINEFWQHLPDGLNRYWYANATRFIPFTIHEFPSYSFVVSDVHGHVLSLPFVLLAIALLFVLFTGFITREIHDKASTTLQSWLRLIFYGFLVSILLMTNALDGPIYMGLFIIILGVYGWRMSKDKLWWRGKIIATLVVLIVALLTSLPFLLHFSSFVTGLAVNCPPAALADHKVGIILFEGVEKCQHSPLWMMAILWGFFVYCGVFFVLRVLYEGLKKKQLHIKCTQTEFVLFLFFIFSVGLIIFPEFFYFKDIYPMHFRSNTMFKLGYQAFIMFSLVSGYTIIWSVSALVNRVKTGKVWHKLFLLLCLPLLFLVVIYPNFSVRSYFDSLRHYEGLNGLSWFAATYPDDYAAIQYLDLHVSDGVPGSSTPVLVEADGDSYTDYARFSAFTGIPAVIGWPVHEWLWRGSYDVVAPRRNDVAVIYGPGQIDETQDILQKYHVRYIMVGTLEWQKYPSLSLSKFEEMGKRVFSSGSTSIYEVVGE